MKHVLWETLFPCTVMTDIVKSLKSTINIIKYDFVSISTQDNTFKTLFQPQMFSCYRKFNGLDSTPLAGGAQYNVTDNVIPA